MMASIKQTAETYEAPQTENIADLGAVMVEWELHEKQGKDADGVEYSYNVIHYDHKDYRVPNSVLGMLKDILKEKPDLKSFRVIKTGKGMQTRYTVIPLE